MTMTIPVVAAIILCVVSASITWAFMQVVVLAYKGAYADLQVSSSNISHDWQKECQRVSSAAEQRESRYREEIRALTEAIGRSKEMVAVIYPEDRNRPLEEIPGYYHGTSMDPKPKVTVSTKVNT